LYSVVLTNLRQFLGIESINVSVSVVSYVWNHYDCNWYWNHWNSVDKRKNLKTLRFAMKSKIKQDRHDIGLVDYFLDLDGRLWVLAQVRYYILGAGFWSVGIVLFGAYLGLIYMEF
jgi:hypothetical protein